MEKAPKFQHISNESFSEIQASDSEETIGEQVQRQRDEKAAEIREIRAERDEQREKSKKISSKLRGAFSMKNSDTELARDADQLQRKAKEKLYFGIQQLRYKEDMMIREVVEEGVIGPLHTLFKAESIENADEALSEIDFKAMSRALDSLGYGKRIRETLDYGIRNATNESVPQFAEVLFQLAEQNFIAGDWEEAFHYINALNFRRHGEVFKSLGEEQKKHFIQNLEAHPDILGSSMEKNYSLVEFCFENGGEISENAFEHMLNEVSSSNKDIYIYGKLVQHYLNGDKKELMNQRVTEHLGKYLLSQFGVEFGEIADVWTFGVVERDIAFNLRIMRKIESELEGGVRKLIDTYGIKEFQRYPVEVLVTQLKEEEVQQPYGIVMFPRSDHNGAFDLDSESIQHLYDSTKGKHALKIFEVGRMWEVARHLTKLDEVYGSENKISFAVFGGHGNTDGIHLGRFGKSSAFYINDAEKASVGRAKKFFVDSPEIVMVSCSTGAPNGIGQAISKSLEARVVAPSKKGALSDLVAIYDENGKVSIEVKFSVEHNRYAAGLPVSED